MVIIKNKIKRILVISLTNIGDVVLTFPVIDILKHDFPASRLSVVVGPKGEPFFRDNKFIDRTFVFYKNQSWLKTLSWIWQLRKESFDLVVDLRNTMIPFLVSTRYVTPPFLKRRSGFHMREQHLARLRSVYPFRECPKNRYALAVSSQDQLAAANLICQEIGDRARYVVIAPGAADDNKRWPEARFAQLAEAVVRKYGVHVVFVGHQGDRAIAEAVCRQMPSPAVNLCGRLSLPQLSVVLSKSLLAVVNDSAPMHLASYLNIPTLALFGPTDPTAYGPWSGQSVLLERKALCPACRQGRRGRNHQCMEKIGVEDVLNSFELTEDGVVFFRRGKKLRGEAELSSSAPLAACSNRGQKPLYRNILIIRTDRVGDVVLTTPAIRALRKAFPQARISILVAEKTRELVEGNPHLDQVLVADWKGAQGRPLVFLDFVRQIRAQRFDLVINFHTKQRTNLLCWLAGIPTRVGYRNNKLGFLINLPLRDDRPLGAKHEAFYCLDLLRVVGVEDETIELFLPLEARCEEWADAWMNQRGIPAGRRLIALHVGASCPTKLWPVERFEALIQSLWEKYHPPIVLIGSKDAKDTGEKICRRVQVPLHNLTAQTSLGQLASLLKRCGLLISNDSGPGHMAAALGTPVVAIFTRNQPGINPKRWKPLGDKSLYVAPPQEQTQSFAKGVVTNNAYLYEIRVEDVLPAVDALYKLC